MNGDISHSEPEPPSLPRQVTIERESAGYGFNLHGEKGVHGQYISAVDEGSPAERNDLRVGDRVIAVNNEDVEDLAHSKVVERIRAGGNKVTLLVVDEQCDQFYKNLGVKIPQDRFEIPNLSPPEVPEESPAFEESNSTAPDQNETENVDSAPPAPVEEPPSIPDEPNEPKNNADDDGYEEVISQATPEVKPAEVPAESPKEIVPENPPEVSSSVDSTQTTTTTTTTTTSNGPSEPSHDFSKLDMAAARPKPKRNEVKRATQNWKQKYDDFNQL